MIDAEALLIIPLSFAGFILKAITAFGPGIVMVPAGALIFGARDMVLLSGCLDLISNACLLRPHNIRLRNRFWLIMLLSMITGTAIGAMLLSFLPGVYFDLIFGMIMIPLGFWTLFKRGENTHSSAIKYPLTVRSADILVAFLSGCMSGISGITAPVLAWYFNRQYNKQVYRDIMIPLLLASATSRVVVYSLSGALTTDILPLLVLALPGLAAGLWLGNRLYLKVSQQWLNALIGSLVFLSGIKLLIK